MDTIIDERSPLVSHYERLSDPSDQRTARQRKISIWLILLSAGLERLAFYSLAGNLVLFLTSHIIHWQPAHGLTVSFIFLGISYVSALFFAWLSDSKIGRAKTIILGFILYIIGYIFITLISNDHALIDDSHKILCARTNSSTNGLVHEECFPQLLSALIVTAIGAGAVQANMAVFGAEQVREQRTARQYFEKYYAAVNIGGLIAFAFISYAQQNESYAIGYAVPAGLLVLALFFFWIGYKFYIHIQPEDSVLSKLIPVTINAYRTWRKQRRYIQTSTANSMGTTETLFPRTNRQSWSFLDYAKLSNQGDFLDRIVDDIKSVRRIIVVFLLLIPYWLIYLQIETTFLIQGAHMKVPHLFNTTSDQHYMPIIWLSLSDQLIIIFIIFILNTFIYKRLENVGRLFSFRSRILLGMTLAMIAMCTAGTIEIYRQNSCNNTVTQIIGHTNYTAADMSIFYQFPQYIAIGVSEVFASVATLEFAYLAAPNSAQSLIMSLRFCSAGLSAFIGSIYVSVFAKVNENLTFNNEQCDNSQDWDVFHYYFFALAGLQLIFIGIFLVCDKKFQLLRTPKRRLTTRLFVGSTAGTTAS